MYADQPSGLGGEIVLFDSGDPEQGSSTSANAPKDRWMDQFLQWEKDGRPQGQPPGVANAGPPLTPGSGAAADYMLYEPTYLLRPEVSPYPHACFLAYI
jgi:hypothetical protein